MANTKRIILTKARVAALPVPTKGRPIIFDDRIPGFGVRLTPNGVRTFILRRKINGRAQMISMGRFPGLGVEQARKIAVEMIGQIARSENPQDVKRKARQEKTFGELWGNYFEGHLKPNTSTWEKAKARYERYLKPWADRKISSITFWEVRSLHNRIGKNNGHYAANRILQLTRAMYNWGAPKIENPAKGVGLFHEFKRERFLQPDELPRFFEALAAESNQAARDCVLLCLLTGARRTNVLSMRWEEINLDRGTWTIPPGKPKSDDPITIPLHPEAVSLLEHRQSNVKSDWVFPGRGRNGHMVEPKKFWHRIRERAGLPDLRLHDLRRTLGSWQAAQGASLIIIGKSLGHRNPASTAIYARLNIDPVRQSVNSAIDAILAMAAQTPDSRETKYSERGNNE